MDTRLLLTAYRKSPTPYPMVPSPTLYETTTYRSSTIPHDWLNIVHYYPLKSSNVNDLYLS